MVKTLFANPNRQLLQLSARLRAAALPEPVALLTSPSERVTGYALHPCAIQGRPTLIHAAGLAEHNPAFYRALAEFARSQGYVLQPERRQHDNPIGHERRRLIPALLITVAMHSSVFARSNDAGDNGSAVSELGLYGKELPVAVAGTLSEPEADSAASRVLATPASEPDFALTSQVAEVLAILSDHYRPNDNDPDYLESDLLEMAVYFSRYPAAVNLLREIAGSGWQLQFRENTFRTQVRGSRFRVSSAVVYFDSRAAAQLRMHRACDEKLGACIASPADALLHELLHAKAALLTPNVFIEQGGMNSVLYPYAHEQAVIAEENQLYLSMTAIDGQSRPQRHAHSGRLAAANCVTCIQ